MSPPSVRPGQEWEKRHNDGPSSPPTRIRVVAIQDATPVRRASALVESQINDGWGRRRLLLLSKLNNQPSGYRLVQDAP